MANSGEPRRQRGSEETVRRVIEAAAAEFVERGYDNAVISNIARRAGVTTGAIYPRWAHKSDLMDAAVDHLLEQLLPAQRVRNMGIAELPTPDIMAAWGANLLSADAVQDVLVQVFGSARNNAVLQERLQRFLDEQADQLSRRVEASKQEGFCDPELDTVALTMLFQALGIGIHLILSGGLLHSTAWSGIPRPFGQPPTGNGSLSQLLHPKGRRSFEQLTLLAQPKVLPAQLGQLGPLAGRHSLALAAVDARLACFIA